MIVYGDPQFEIESSLATRRLRELLQLADSRRLDHLRDFLIATGQIEQAIEDAGAENSAITRATDLAADHFVRAFLDRGKSEKPSSTPLQAAAACIDIALAHNDRLRLKLPEGFAFYTLYPEQYCDAALAWSRSRPPTRTLVIGIRSIGTTLSAVVKATLGLCEWHAERITVRPTGPPFERTVQLRRDRSFESAIVVDEGPGLSGSSMACVARALRDGGVRDITFFPGHAQPPGAATSENVRTLWSEIPAVVRPAITSDLSQSRAVQSLRQSTEGLFRSPIAEILDLSAGKWRTLPGLDSIHATPELERAKYLFRSENRRALLWKFAGLGPGRALEPLSRIACERQSHLAAAGWCPPPLDLEFGFIATEWIDGRTLTPLDLSGPMLNHLAQYIAFSVREPLPTSEQQQSLARLAEMTRWNLQKAGLSTTPPPIPNNPQALPSSGDGRLAPHEWIRAGNKTLKTDTWGHDFDHSIIGPQAIFWDIACAIVEWRMTPAQIPRFLQALGDAGQARSDFRDMQFFSSLPNCASNLRFHIAAYCAFRIGTASLSPDAPALKHYSALAADFLDPDGGRPI